MYMANMSTKSVWTLLFCGFLISNVFLWQTPSATTVLPDLYPNSTGFYPDFLFPDVNDIFSMPSWDNIHDALQEKKTVDFLDRFPNESARELIQQQLLYCPYTSLCTFSLNLTDLSPFSEHISCCANCSCDTECYRRGTCCPDVVLLGLTKPAVQVTEQCTRPLFGSPEVGIGYLMTTSCPPVSDITLSNKCSMDHSNATAAMYIGDVTPVTHTHSNMTFRNKYCAECHGLSYSDSFHLEQWDAMISCSPTHESEFESMQQLIRDITAQNSSCGLIFLPPRHLENECTPTISHCPDVNNKSALTNTSHFQQWGCETFTMHYSYDGLKYKNVFCALCQGVIPPEPVCWGFTFDTDVNSFSFSGLLNFQSVDDMENNQDAECNGTQLYDPCKKRCTQMLCTELAQMKNGKCVWKYSKIQNVLYEIGMDVLPRQALTVDEANGLADDIIYTLQTLFQDILNARDNMFINVCSIQVLYQGRRQLNCPEQESCSIGLSDFRYFDAKIILDPGSSYMHDPMSIVEAVNNMTSYLNVTHVRNGRNISYIFDVRYKSIPPDTISLYNTLFELTESLSDGLYHAETSGLNLSTIISMNTTAVKVDKDNIVLMHVRPNDPFLTCFQNEIPSRQLVKIASLVSCPLIQLNKPDRPSHFDGIYIDGSNIQINMSSFIYGSTGSDVLVCYNTYIELVSADTSLCYTVNNNETVEKITTIVCLAISMLCLLISLMTYTLLPPLRTVPGQNNMALMTSLVLAQCFFLIGSFAGLEPNSWICTAVGVLIHFHFLMALFWMNACTFHMFRVFVNISQTITSGSKFTVLVYVVYTSVLSTMCVLSNIIVSVVSNNGSFGYGNTRCYINTGRMVAFTFGVPTAVVIVCNAAMFITVVIKIKTAPTVQKNVKNERNDLFIFIKLSTVTGASWVFGFLHSWTGFVLFSYLFIIFNAGQGVFLFFAFVCNKRIANMYVHRFTNTGQLSTVGGSRYRPSTVTSQTTM